MLKEYHITLREVTTKDMIIVAPTKMEAANTALRFHFGESDQEDTAMFPLLSAKDKTAAKESSAPHVVLPSLYPLFFSPASRRVIMLSIRKSYSSSWEETMCSVFCSSHQLNCFQFPSYIQYPIQSPISSNRYVSRFSSSRR